MEIKKFTQWDEQRKEGIKGYVAKLLNVDGHLTESQYHVLSVRHHGTEKGRKTEAVLSMPKEMGQKLLKFHGEKIENCHLDVKRTKECNYGNRCYNAKKHCPFYHGESVMLKKTKKTVNSNDEVADEMMKSGSDHPKENQYASLWKLRNLPEKMNTLGVVKYIDRLNVVVNETRDQYHVLSVKSYTCKEGTKVEAVMSMPEEMGQRLLYHNGTEIGNSNLEVSRTKVCRYGVTCTNIDRNCSFYHVAKKTPLIDNSKDSQEELKPCWFIEVPEKKTVYGKDDARSKN